MRFKNVAWNKSDNPGDILQRIAVEHDLRIDDEEFCRFLDENDELHEFKSKFIFPNYNSKSSRVVTGIISGIQNRIVLFSIYFQNS